jgi:hypothetical protein
MTARTARIRDSTRRRVVEEMVLWRRWWVERSERCECPSLSYKTLGTIHSKKEFPRNFRKGVEYEPGSLTLTAACKSLA